MPEPKTCFVCGRTHDRASRVCAACAAAYASPGPVDLGPANATPLASPTELPAPDAPRVPLPPQLRTPPPADTAPPRPAAAPSPPVALCPSCGAQATGSFTFCTACGADLPSTASVQPQSAPSATGLPPGVRDTRATVRRIAEAYGPGPESGQAQTQAERPAEPMGAEEERLAHPMTLALLSFFFPGVGQFLNRQSAKGFALLIAGFITVTLMGMAPFAFVLVTLRVLVAIDAYRIGQRRARGETVPPDEWDLR